MWCAGNLSGSLEPNTIGSMSLGLSEPPVMDQTVLSSVTHKHNTYTSLSEPQTQAVFHLLSFPPPPQSHFFTSTSNINYSVIF